MKRDFYYKSKLLNQYMFHIGILMPRSTLIPALGLDILNGIKQNLKRYQVLDDIKFTTDNIGFGVNEQDIYTKAEALILASDVDIVVAIADVRMTEMLHPLFAASNKILLVLNFGANFPDSWQAPSTTICHSLNFSFQTWLTGALAARKENKNAANVLSYYDAGYRQVYSMMTSHQTNAGVPTYNHITHLKLEEFTLKPLEQFLQQNIETKTLLCLFAAEQAEKFYTKIISIQQALQLDLFVSPMMLDETLKEVLPADINIQSVQGYVPWHSSLDNEENVLFKETIKAATNKPANYFSLLGWEAGIVINEIISTKTTDNIVAADMVSSLTKLIFKSPRGIFKIDHASHQSYGSAYVASCKDSLDVNIETSLENIDEAWLKFKAEMHVEGDDAGWKNTYLCI
jgi:branched-chain amino acid transport system substrate-binding protein